jgi:acyl carrier protein
MEKSEVLNQFGEIFNKVLDISTIVLTTETVANDIEEWDSLTHVQLIVAIEKHFKIRFLSSEIRSWKNVGEMVEAVINKLNAP